ncbi:MAG TPA: alpha/beta hydrolase [Gemmatimonadales bacterium]
MLWLRIVFGLALAYVGLLGLAWLFQERIAFPAPRAPVPDPKDVGIPGGERFEVVTKSGVRLVGWFLAPKGNNSMNPGASPRGQPTHPVSRSYPGLLWFYGNGENIASIWPILRDFQPPGTALLAVDYPGYGGSAGRATESAIYEAADAAYEELTGRADVDPQRVYVYGRSVGSAAATYTASTHPTAGLILESPFTSAWEMSRQHYGIFPRFILRLKLDNVAGVSRIRCPLLVFHGTEDRLVSPEMGRRVAEAAPGPVELVQIEGAGHNETYDVGGRTYRDKLWEFVTGGSTPGRRPGVNTPGPSSDSR